MPPPSLFNGRVSYRLFDSKARLQIVFSLGIILLLAAGCSTSSESLQPYANPLYSFNYPSRFRLEGERVVAQHQIDASGKDDFGLSELLLHSQDTSALVTIESIPNWQHLSEADALSAARLQLAANERSGDILETISVSGLASLHGFLPAYDTGEAFRTGTNEVVIPTQNFVLTLRLTWSDATANSVTSRDQQAFQAIVNSLKISSQ